MVTRIDFYGFKIAIKEFTIYKISKANFISLSLSKILPLKA